MKKNQIIIDFNTKITFEVGHNEFSDWTEDELSTLTGFIADDSTKSHSQE